MPFSRSRRPAPPRAWLRPRFRLAPSYRLAIAYFAGIAAGALFGPSTALLRPLADLFMAALTAAGPPVALFALLSSLVALSGGQLARVGMAALASFLGTAFLASAIGIAFAEAWQVGVDFAPDAADEAGPSAVSAITPALERFGELVRGVLSHLVFWSIFLVLLARRRRTAEPAGDRAPLLDDCVAVSFSMVGKVLAFAPLGIFALAAVAFAQVTFAAAAELLSVVLATYTGQALVTVLALGMLPLAGVAPLPFLRQTGSALITAFATGSSAATAPVEIAAAEQRLKVRRDHVGLVLPLGLAIHKIGSAVFLSVILIFAANAAGQELQFVDLAQLTLLALVASVITPPISGGVLVALSVVASTVGLPMAVLLIAATVPFAGKLNTPLNSLGRLISVAVLAARASGETPAGGKVENARQGGAI